MTPKERATKCAEVMWENDSASKWLGMKIERVDEGSATLSLEIGETHTNGHNICHGGIIFSLADSAFAFACNSYNQNTVAQHNTITYVAPAKLGDTLIATAKEISKSGRSGIYDVNVSNNHGETIAEFRGCSRTITGKHFEDRKDD